MNYRHAFHAGNFADVFKHALLTRILLYLMRKDAPLRYIDTHSGIGRYDLSSEEALRTGEWRDGIGRLLGSDLPPAAAELLQPYLQLIPGTAEAPGPYPGSPLIAQKLLRSQDRMTFSELHEHDSRRLVRALGREKRCKILTMDGYQALKAGTPPIERRGLALMDPPFEERDEFEHLALALENAWAKWPTGAYAIWYPLKVGGGADVFRQHLAAGPVRKVLCLELDVDHLREVGPLKGCGLILVNPPFVLEEEARILLPVLAARLAQGPGAAFRIAWLTGE
jgi:23S rRNA (adenine2030-N6)-methyltransferase